MISKLKWLKKVFTKNDNIFKNNKTDVSYLLNANGEVSELENGSYISQGAESEFMKISSKVPVWYKNDPYIVDDTDGGEGDGDDDGEGDGEETP